jgi:hypothetical protein
VVNLTANPVRRLVRRPVRRSFNEGGSLAETEALAKADVLNPHALRDRLALPAVGRGKLRPMAVITAQYR